MTIPNFSAPQRYQLSQKATTMGVTVFLHSRHEGGDVAPTKDAHSDSAAGELPAAFGGARAKVAALGLLVPPQQWEIAGLPAWVWGVGSLACAVVALSQLPAGLFGVPKVSRIPRSVRIQFRRHPGPGFAGRWTLWRRYGKTQARKVALRGRKSLTWGHLLFGPSSEYATFHGKAQGWLHRWGVYSNFEQIVLVVAPPQEGKSLKAAASIIDAPGPVVVTSIRGDLIKLTVPLRQHKGHVWCWNPEQVGHYTGNFRWNPVAGCQDMMTATRRAYYLVYSSKAEGLAEAGFWLDQGSMLLSALMHAAGLVGGNLKDVHEWILTRSGEPLDILLTHPYAHEQSRLIVDEWRHNMDEKTRSGVITTLTRTFQFMLNPSVVHTLTPPMGERTFDFASFVQSKDTLYLVSSGQQHGSAGPLFAAFLGELAEFARMYGSKRVVSGQQVSRLDPPMTFELDEICNIAYIPVDSWASWAAGSGIRIHAYLQTWAGAVERWGPHGASALWGNSKMKIIYSGVTELALLDQVSKLLGKVRLREDHGQSAENRQGGQYRYRYVQHDVIDPAGASMVPRGYALVIGSGAKPTVVQAASVLRNKRFKAMAKQLAKGEVKIGLGPVVERPLPPVMPEIRGQVRQQQPQPRPEVAPVRDELGERRRARQAPPLFGEETVPASYPQPGPPRGQRQLETPSWYQPADPAHAARQQAAAAAASFPQQQRPPENTAQLPSEEELRKLGWWGSEGASEQ